MGWTNQVPFPFIIIDPTTGNPIFIIDSKGAHLISPQTGIDLIQGPGGPPLATIQFTDLSGGNADPGRVSGQSISGAMAILLDSGEGTIGVADGGSSHIQLSAQHAVFDYQDIRGTGGSTRIAMERDAINISGSVGSANNFIRYSGEDWTDIGLLNGWVNRAGWDHAAFKLFPDGTVHLRGSISGGTSASGTQIGSIPAGYRPATHDAVEDIASDNIPAAYAAANGSPRMQVQLGGNMFIYGTGAGPLFLDGFNYSTI